MKLIALSSVLLLAILAFYGTSTALRHSAEPGLERISKTGKRFLEFMTEGKLSGRVDTEAVGRFGSLVMRTSHLWVFHIVEDKSPDPVPYWKGESYKPLFTSFIPRVLYPGKPEERAGSEFGRRFGFLTPRDLHISFNLPWITEMAANFGPWGVVGGMCLVGLFLGFLERVFNAPGMTDLEFTLGLSLIFPLVYPESNFSVMVGSMLPLFIALLVYFCVGSLALKQAEKFGWSGDG